MTTKTKSPASTLKLLKALFPASIGADLPLKVGIHVDVAAEVKALSANDIADALDLYVNSTPYHRSVARSLSQRVDLYGKPVEPVAADQRMIAAAVLNDRAAQDNLRAAKSIRADVAQLVAALGAAAQEGVLLCPNAARVGVTAGFLKDAIGIDDGFGEFDEK